MPFRFEEGDRVKLNAKADYAMRILLYLAEDGSTRSSADMSRDLAISRNYIVLLMQPLRDAGMVESIPGKRGGYRLAIPAEQVTAADVAEAIGGFELRPGASAGGLSDVLDGFLRIVTLRSLLDGERKGE